MSDAIYGPRCPEPTAVARRVIDLEWQRLTTIRAVLREWRECVDAEGQPDTARRSELARQLEALVRLDGTSDYE